MEFQVNSVRTLTRILALTWFLAAAAPSNEPTITTSNSTVVVLRGQDALLTCTAKHLGKEVLDWVFEIDDTLIYHDQQLMVDDPRYSLLHTNDSDRYDLRITSVQDSDQGSYRCEVFLSVGVTIDLVVTDAEVPLEPNVKPDPPRNVTLIQTFNNGSYGIVVTWKPPADRPWTVAGYRISYANILDRWPRSTAVLSSKSESFTISPVIPNTHYILKMVSLGLLTSSLPTDTVEIMVEERNLPTENYIINCCEERNVPEWCRSTLCRSNTWSSLNESSDLFNECLVAMEDILSCLAGGLNHSLCCVDNNVPTACTGLCGGQPRLEENFFPQCRTKLSTIDACVQRGLSLLPSPPRLLPLTEVSDRSVNIEWQASDTPGTHYIVQLREGRNNSPWLHVNTTDASTASLTNLAEAEFYSVRVVAVNSAGQSLPSVTVYFTTYPEQTLQQERPANIRNLTQCCIDKSLPSVCLAGCTYNHTYKNMMDHFFANDICLPHINSILSCASDGRNHSHCCERSGIRDRCLDLCFYTEVSAVHLGYSHCVSPLHTARTVTCYLEGLSDPPRAPDNVTVSTIAARSISVEWEVPQRGERPTSYYVTCRSLIANRVQTGETTAPLYSFQNLEPETGYEITVSSVLNGFYSLSSPLITAYTMAETVMAGAPATDKNSSAVWMTRTQCCKKSGVSSDCLPLCINKPVESRTKCWKEGPKILTCTTEKKDRRTCCSQAGLRSECIFLCSGSVENFTVVAPDCMEDAAIDIITSCFLPNTGLLPEAPTHFRVLKEMKGGITLTWDMSQKCKKPDPCVFDVHFWKAADMTDHKVIANVTSPYLVTEELHDGEYTFTVTARNSQGSSATAPWQTILLNHVEPDVSIAILPSDVDIFDSGTSILLACDAFNFKDEINFTWTYGEQVLGRKRFLYLGHVTPEQEGLYSCTASTNNSLSTAHRYLNVRYAPLLKDSFMDSLADTPAVLQCWFKGHPFTNASSSTWEKDGKPISDPRYFTSERTDLDTGDTYFQLIIEDVVPSDYGFYQCVAYNQYGSSSGQVRFTEPDLVSTTPVTPIQNATGNATDCCRKVGVPDLCLPLCYHTFNLIEFLDKAHASCSDHLQSIVRCDAGTDDFDHTQCCRESRVPEFCWPVCSGHFSENSSQSKNFNCLSYSNELFDCFETGTSSLPSPPTEVSATLTPNAIKVTWGRPAKNKDKVKWYRVNIASSTKAKPTQHVLTKEFLDYAISNIAPGSSYKIWIVAGNDLGNSQASEAINITVPEDFQPDSAKIQGEGTHDNIFTVPVLAGVVVAAVAVVAAVVVTVAVVCRRRFRRKLAIDSVSFENPSYGNECIRIGALPASEQTEEPTAMQVLAATKSSGSFENSGFKQDGASGSSNPTNTA